MGSLCAIRSLAHRPRRLILSGSTQNRISSVGRCGGGGAKRVGYQPRPILAVGWLFERRLDEKESAMELRKKLTIQQILIDDVTNVR